MKRAACLALSLVGLTAAEAGAAPRGKGPLKISYLEVARQALIDGRLPRAVRALKRARKCWRVHGKACGFIKEDYQALIGIVYLEHRYYGKAVNSFQAVVARQPGRAVIWLYLGQALFRLKRYGEAIVALEKGRAKGARFPVFHLLLARSRLKVGDRFGARQVLLKGLERFPRHRDLLMELTLLYSRSGLYGTAARLARRFLKATGGDPLAALIVSDALCRERHYRPAITLLEEVHLQKPGALKVLERLAYAHAQAGHTYASARLFERLTRVKASYAGAAAEQYRQAGRFTDALRMNRRIPLRRQRLRQRLSIFLEHGDHARALKLLKPLRAARALDDAIRYRLAYAAIRIGDFKGGEVLLKRIASPAFTGRIAHLRTVAAQCAKRPWLCP